MYVFKIRKHSQSKTFYFDTYSIYRKSDKVCDIFARIVKETTAAFPKSSQSFVPIVCLRSTYNAFWDTLPSLFGFFQP